MNRHSYSHAALALRPLVIAGLALLALQARAFEAPATPAMPENPATPANAAHQAPGGHARTGAVEVAFSPWDDAEALLLRTLAAARFEVYVQAYLLTSRNVADGLIEAKARGVRVFVLADGPNVAGSDRSQVPRLAAAGIPVGLETRYSAAHNKVMVIDPEHGDCVVITGSYNYTQSARTKNAENLLVLKGDPVLARAYVANWRRHQKDALPFSRAELKTLAPRPAPAGTPERERLPFPWESGRSPRRDMLEME